MRLGLTGGIACGKSTVLAMFARRGIPTVDADVLARRVVEPGEPAWREIVERFGADILLPDGRIDRKRLGALVFADEAARLDLNRIVHPRVRAAMWHEVEEAERRGAKLVVCDVPLLFESGLEDRFDAVMVVYVPPEEQLRRLMARDGLTREEALARIRAQMPIEEKRRRADYVIDNSGPLAATERQVDAFLRQVGVRP
ncbi:dephospho-CoA kinase [Calditerricola satsumensis]|uniref:Dephospho-CoA kinase n=1 Tax=Calditerricola satsumensis TaxID=373054 RepID=A0A8J3B4L1_9BACI|nr:dephospho-CoA kinase [Calditerricola satsumensis]GGJ93128.1 dephospho-CoA kinase [Calditerricola satsumensis]